MFFFLSILEFVADGVAEHFGVHQPIIHQLQAELQHFARALEDGLGILCRMDLQLLHNSILFLQAVADLQKRLVERGFIQIAANLKRLMDVLFEPRCNLIGRGLTVFRQLSHFLHADFRQFH